MPLSGCITGLENEGFNGKTIGKPQENGDLASGKTYKKLWVVMVTSYPLVMSK